MEEFIRKHKEKIIGALSGFDRLVLRGTLRYLCSAPGMGDFLNSVGVQLEDFGSFVHQTGQRLIKASRAEADSLGRAVKPLPSPRTNKMAKAREIMKADGIEDGIICILTCVEPCRSFKIRQNTKKQIAFLEPAWRQCLHLYHYWIDEEFGFMNARIQTWFPFNIQICLNGREWLARKLDQEGIAYSKSDNCFLDIDDLSRAQELMGQQLKVQWPRLLDNISRRLNPIFSEIFKNFPIQYYWTAYQTEWATDIMFKSPTHLASIYPQLIQSAISIFGSPDVMRFLGGKIFHGNFKGEVMSSYKKRPEGVRVKHNVNYNSVKMYDKKGSILRVETTINKVRDFKVYKENRVDSGNGKVQWRPMKQGISDLYRRVKISHASNIRYLEALSALDTDSKIIDLIQPACQHVIRNGKRIRGLRPWWEEDRDLLAAIRRGEFCVNGFRNRDILEILKPGLFADPKEKRRAAAKITRKIRMLCAHGIIKKVRKTYRYVFTKKGNEIITAILGYQECTLQDLLGEAA